MNTRTYQAPLTRNLLSIVAATVLAAAGADAQQIDMNAWKQSNEYRAMKLQRELSADMPQSQSLVLGSHNSYNSSAYSPPYILYQHSYTLAQQLDLGLRSLDLDVHAFPLNPSELFVTHSTCSGVGSSPVHDLTLAEVLVEIKFWLDNNPDEVLVLCVEPHFWGEYPSVQHARFLTYCEAFLGSNSGNDRLIRPSEIPESELFTSYASWQRRLIEFSDMSLNELREHGRVMFVNIGGAGEGCDDDAHYWPHDTAINNVIFGNAPSFSWCSKPNWNFIEAKRFVEDPTLGYWGSASLGATVRNCATKRSPYTFLYNNTSESQLDDYGSEPPSVMREAIRAGVDSIRFDPVGKSVASAGHVIDFPADEQMRATIWSWDYRYVAPADGVARAGMAVIDGDTARIRWEAPTADMRYAIQDADGRWGISAERGTFSAAPAAFPDGWNFRAPGNGFEMQNLFGAMVRAGITKVWINYHDLDANGAWTASTQKRLFTAPDITAQISPVPILISTQADLLLAQSPIIVPPRPTGLVFSVYPASYAGAVILSNPGTIVPWAPGTVVEIGR